MKNIIFFGLLIVSITAQAQNPYYDAVLLKKFVVNGSFSTDTADQKIYCSILNNYLQIPYKKFNATTIAGEFTDNSSANYNPFLENYFPVTGMGASLLPFNKSLQSTIASIGGVNVTNFADGLAKFLVKRFKEELSISFFEKFNEEINKPEHEDLQLLFAQTIKVLKVAGKDIYNYSAYINTLRAAFIKDLTNLYASFKKVKDLAKYQPYFNSHPELNSLVINAFYFIDQLANGVHPGDVIARYNADAMIQFSVQHSNLQTNIRSSIKLLQLVSNSLKSINIENYWVPADSVLQLLLDPVGRDMYFGLIYQQSGINIHFNTTAGSKDFRQILAHAKKTGDELETIVQGVLKIVQHTQEVNEYVQSIKLQKKSEIDFNEYYKLFNASLDVLNEGINLTNLTPFDINPANLEAINIKASQLLNLARTTGDMYVDIRTRNYSSAILNSISLIDQIFENNYDKNLRSLILKYGNFAANVAAANNSDEVAKAIEAVALPAGNSRVKRETDFNISLNAYVGGFGGNEYLPALKLNKNATAIGFAAPVGLAFSWGKLGKKGSNDKKGGKSLSLFIPLIDVGSLASFRLQNDSSKVASEIQLKNIVAPGLFIYYGLGKCPISIGAGLQIGPQLREVTAQDINIEKNYYLRYGISICVDIPLLNFFSKTK